MLMLRTGVGPNHGGLLSIMWDHCRKAEKLWLSAKAENERKLTYLCKRKEFQGCKRAYWYNKQNEILEAHGNPHEFWRMVNSWSVGSKRKSSIPMMCFTISVICHCFMSFVV